MLPNSAPDQNPLTEVPLATSERRALLGTAEKRERLIFAIARHLIPIIGIFFLGWSAGNIVVLYFADTLGALWAIFCAGMFQFSPGLFQQSLPSRLWTMGGLAVVGLFLVAFFAVPLGMPLFFVTVSANWSWQEAVAEQGFVFGLITIVVLSVVGMARHTMMLRSDPRGMDILKREFGIVMTRWVIVILLVYFIALLLGEWGMFILVLAYAGGTIAAEVAPDRFANLFGNNASKIKYDTPVNGELARSTEEYKQRHTHKKKKKRN